MKPIVVPTVITDVNGKITTVHKRQDAPQGASCSIPAPSIGAEANKPRRRQSEPSRWNPITRIAHSLEREKLAGEITDRLFLPDDRVRSNGTYTESETIRALRQTDSTAYLRDMALVADLVTRNGTNIGVFNEGRNAVLSIIKSGDGGSKHSAEIRSIAAYRDWIISDELDITKFVLTHRMIAAAWENNIIPDGTVTNIQSHLRAMYSNISPTKKIYGKKTPVAWAVENHPEMVDQIISYVRERGRDNFDEKAFLEYMDAPAEPLREGWL